MDRPKQRYSVKDVLAILDDDNSEFGSADESDTDTDYEHSDREKGDDDTQDEDSDDTIVDPPQATILQETYVWRRRTFDPPNTTFTGQADEPVINVDTPLNYFRKFIAPIMLDNVVESTNQYSIQKSGICIDTNVKELEQVLGMYFRMGLVRMTGTRMYWEKETRYDLVAGVMPRNRFQDILQNIHFVNNLGEHDAADKLWKIRPWLFKFRENCLKIVPDENNSIDEMMVPFKGKFSGIKQYIRGKPNPWGLKIWARTTTSGLLCDFEVYQGQGHVGPKEKNKLGIAANVILNLCKTLPSDQHYKVYADNYFTSVPLITELQKRAIDFVGTVRNNRMKGCMLKSEKVLQKEGRGKYDYKVETNSNIIAVRWMDTKAVTVLSNFAGVTPTEDVKRWSKVAKDYFIVPRPYSLSVYNQNMGGVDQLYSLLAKNRNKIISRRWYLYLFWHTTYIGLTNAWLSYKRDCKQLNIPTKDIMIFRKFQGQVAASLVGVNVIKKRGRPSLDGEDDHATPRRKHHVQGKPTYDIRYDTIDHLPEKKPSRGRCSVCVKNATKTFCCKCNVRLCFNEKRNCFKDYHLKR